MKVCSACQRIVDGVTVPAPKFPYDPDPDEICPWCGKVAVEVPEKCPGCGEVGTYNGFFALKDRDLDTYYCKPCDMDYTEEEI